MGGGTPAVAGRMVGGVGLEEMTPRVLGGRGVRGVEETPRLGVGGGGGVESTPTVMPSNIHHQPQNRPITTNPLLNWNIPNSSHPIPVAPPSTTKDKSLITVNDHTYTRLSLIGRGGSSKVYKIVNERGEVYALKKVKLRGVEEGVLEGYLGEVGLLERLGKGEGKGGVVRLVEWEVRRGEGVLEYGEIDLAHLLQREMEGGRVVPMSLVEKWWEQMCRAVMSIHEEGVIHSDLKPANFLLVDGELKLIDFGIAKSIPNDTTNIKREHQTGTINYMAPEAITFVNEREKDPYLKLGRSSDVWSLGCILYQLMYGKPPFAHLPVVGKLRSICDEGCEILFPGVRGGAGEACLCVVGVDVPPSPNANDPNVLKIPVESVVDLVREIMTVQNPAVERGLVEGVAKVLKEQLASGRKVDLSRFKR
ncbi:Dual-specificity kinase, spindle pole body (SPB) duplication and spindle checkpoint function [Rhizophlyctis rosea]|nr:Dual-specificity kinase, spindle pole body (SPB) duplication and spindle checkpoint function [Rhizophlyctis rosea]